MRRHIRAGGLACVLEEGINGQMITLYDNGAHLPLLWTHLVPATLEGKALHNVQNAMFAAVMGHAMGVKIENVRHGLRTFDTSYYQAPGRMNVYDDHPFKVILDYGHNPAAVRAMADLVGKLAVEGRRLCVLAGPGDRRDEDLREIAAIAAGAFDFVILRRDDDLRGRGPDDVPKLMAREMIARGFPEDRLRIIPDEQEAIEAGLALARRGDLLLIFADKVSRSWKQVIYFKKPPEPEAPPVEAPLAALSTPPDVSTGPLPEAWIQDARGVRLARDTED